MKKVLKRLWLRVHEPRVISTLYCLIYLVLFFGGLFALINPPASIKGEIGEGSMRALAGFLTVGGALGAIPALLGIWWLERIAVLCVALASSMYALTVGFLQFSETGSNRLLQLSFVVSMLLMQIIRWHRIRERPYDPERAPNATKKTQGELWTREPL